MIRQVADTIRHLETPVVPNKILKVRRMYSHETSDFDGAKIASVDVPAYLPGAYAQDFGCHRDREEAF